MRNKDIAKSFQFLAKIMELHGESSFKTKSYTNAYMTIKKLPVELESMSKDEISKISGIGKAISEKIDELLTAGTISNLQQYQEITPVGIQELLSVKGLGPKKIRVIWDDLEVTSPGELLYACNENRLTALKGFGAKTQETLKAQLMYFLDSKGKSHFANVEPLAHEILNLLHMTFPEARHEMTGEFRRQNTIIERLEILTTQTRDDVLNLLQSKYESFTVEKEQIYVSGTHIVIISVGVEDFVSQLFITTGPENFVSTLDLTSKSFATEEALFADLSKPYMPAYLRDEPRFWTANVVKEEDIITAQDIKGVIHSHSTWSDGVNTIKEMALEAQRLGYEYLLMTDHSQSAFYANGLNVDRVLQQMEEIDLLNEQMEHFTIFKGIESDILNNGALDYDDEILELFDVVIASVHSNLRMDEKKATQRLLNAIESPYTHILGHPTGRLLLSREGYPIDVDAVIQACADNDVVIELNANPHRLDIDWRYIQKAMDAGVQIAINPDSHSIKGIQDIKYGVLAAQKGGLTKAMCLNTKSLSEFRKWVDTLKY